MSVVSPSYVMYAAESLAAVSETVSIDSSARLVAAKTAEFGPPISRTVNHASAANSRNFVWLSHLCQVVSVSSTTAATKAFNLFNNCWIWKFSVVNFCNLNDCS